MYRISNDYGNHKPQGMFDRGANGGVASDTTSVRVIEYYPNNFIDIQGIDSHTLSRVRLGTVGCVVSSDSEEIILIMRYYAIWSRGKMIHSCIHCEDHGTYVNDTAIAFGGQQRIVTNEGHSIPLDIRNGLVYMPSRPYTNKEWNELPHVELTRNAPWDPSIYDFSMKDQEEEDRASYQEDLKSHGLVSRVPRNPREVFYADRTNRNQRWEESMRAEMRLVGLLDSVSPDLPDLRFVYTR